MRSLLAPLAVALLLAGCVRPDDGLHVTATTGAIRGLVVDPAIRPLPGVEVVLPATAATPQRVATTDAQGLFAFSDVVPGSHYLRVAKDGYAMVQQAVDVAAGDAAPPLLKVLLESVPRAAPYVEEVKFAGFIECGVSAGAACSLVNGPTCGVDPLPCTPDATNDRFAAVVPIAAPPTWIQSEMVWNKTTTGSDRLLLWHSDWSRATDGHNGSCSTCWVAGPSPLLLATNATVAAQQEYGTRNDLELRVFASGMDGTGDPLDPGGCFPETPPLPIVGSQYCNGVGASVEQSFTVYTHVFYGFAPPAGWRFTDAGTVPPAPAP